MQTIEQIYQQHIKTIPVDEQLCLVNLITQMLIEQNNNESSLEKSNNPNWRETMSEKIKIIQPMTDIWEDYI